MSALAPARPPDQHPEPGLGVHLLGGFTVRLDGQPLALTRSGQRLLALLALHRRPVDRGTVAGTVWADSLDATGAANLRATLTRLVRPAGRRLVVASRGSLALPDGVHVDLWTLDDELRHVPDRRVPDGTQHLPGGGLLDRGDGISLLQQELLPGWGEEWVLGERERHRQRRLHALERLAAALTREQRYAEALEAGLAAVSVEPLRETAHRVVVEAHLAEGNDAEALRQYETYTRLLRAELGLSPSSSMRSLVGPLLSRPADPRSRTGVPRPQRSGR